MRRRRRRATFSKLANCAEEHDERTKGTHGELTGQSQQPISVPRRRLCHACKIHRRTLKELCFPADVLMIGPRRPRELEVSISLKPPPIRSSLHETTVKRMSNESDTGYGLAYSAHNNIHGTYERSGWMRETKFATNPARPSTFDFPIRRRHSPECDVVTAVRPLFGLPVRGDMQSLMQRQKPSLACRCVVRRVRH